MDLEQYARSTTQCLGLEVPKDLILIISRVRPKSLLDLGCGDGAWLAALGSAHLVSDVECWGADGSAERLQRVKNRCPWAKTQQVDLNGPLPWEDASFDFVINTQVIEHLENQQTFLGEVSRVLKPGGGFYLTTVFKKSYAWYFYRCRGQWVLDPTHLREYRNDDELLPDVRRAGFEIIEESKIPLAYPLVDPLLKRLGAQLQARVQDLIPSARRLQLYIPGYFTWQIVAHKV